MKKSSNKKKKTINTCKKGKAGERELANWLRDRGIPDARRTQQHNGSEGLSDVVAHDSLPHWHLESKRIARKSRTLGSLKSWATQLKRDCAEGQFPVLFMRPDKGEFIALFFLEVIKRFWLNEPQFLVSTEESFNPSKLIEAAVKTQRVHNNIYGINKPQGDVVAIFEIEEGLEFYAMEGNAALAHMIMLESTLGKNNLPRIGEVPKDSAA